MKTKLVGLALAASGVLSGAPARLVEGNATSDVHVVIYEDLQCSDCARFRTMLDETLLPKYKARVAFEHRDFPLTKHAWARKAAVAARHFERVAPELSIRFRQYVFANQPKITVENFNKWLMAFAKKQGQDGKAAVAALERADLAAAVETDYQEGVARGIAKTPTVLVNGQPFIETFTVEELSAAIDSQLK